MSAQNTQNTATYTIVGQYLKAKGRLTHLATISRVAQMQLSDPDQPHTLMAWSDNNPYPVIIDKSSDYEEIEERFKRLSSLVLKMKKRKFVHVKKVLFAKDLIANITPVVGEDRVLLGITPRVADAKPTWITYDSEEELNEALEKIEQQLVN